MTALVDSMCDLRTMRVDIDAPSQGCDRSQENNSIDPVNATIIKRRCRDLDIHQLLGQGPEPV